MMRTCAVLLLSLAFAGAPVIADYCAVSCEAAHMGGASASPAHAGHHHAPTPLASIGQPPQPCGHDHNGIVGVVASSDNANARPLTPASTAVMPASPVAPCLWMLAYDVDGSNSPPGTVLRGFASPLRV